MIQLASEILGSAKIKLFKDIVPDGHAFKEPEAHNDDDTANLGHLIDVFTTQELTVDQLLEVLCNNGQRFPRHQHRGTDNQTPTYQTPTFFENRAPTLFGRPGSRTPVDFKSATAPEGELNTLNGGKLSATYPLSPDISWAGALEMKAKAQPFLKVEMQLIPHPLAFTISTFVEDDEDTFSDRLMQNMAEWKLMDADKYIMTWWATMRETGDTIDLMASIQSQMEAEIARLKEENKANHEWLDSIDWSSLDLKGPPEPNPSLFYKAQKDRDS